MNSFRRNRNWGLLKLFWFLASSSILFGCASGRNSVQEITGKYVWSEYYGAGSDLQLNPDQTFIYHWYEGLLDGETKGTWQLSENTLILTSDKQPPTARPVFSKLLASEIRGSDSVFIQVRDQAEEPVPFANCVFKKGDDQVAAVATDFYGLARFPKVAADSILIFYVGYHTVRYPIADPNVDFYFFQIHENPWSYYRFFVNEEWKFADGKLFDPRLRKYTVAKTQYLRKIKE